MHRAPPLKGSLLLALFPAFLLAGSSAFAQQCEPEAPADTAPPNDTMSPTRVLRRVSLALTGTTPSVEQYEALLAAPTAEARESLLKQDFEDLLASPRFYERMVNYGHDWIGVGAFTTGAQGDAYQGDMAGHLFMCGADTQHPGAWYHDNELGLKSINICNDQDASGNPAVASVHEVEPWWAPGTTVQVLGNAGTGITTVQDDKGNTLDCGIATGGYYDPMLPRGCGCGPNLVWCSPLGSAPYKSSNTIPDVQRRHPYEEPARLFAHLAWHDRPLSDLVIGNYSVGTNWLRDLYVRFGRQMGSSVTDANTTWWRPADGAPRDPLHPDPDDPGAWREFVVQDLEPYHLALTPDHQRSGSLERTYAFDPRTTTEAPEGIPTAGVLTMIGSMSSFARERVRAARFLEIFACQNFTPPPADVHFPPYEVDPATGGTCMHCHRTLDPAAIFFKRWDFNPATSYYVPWPFIPGVGNQRITAAWLSGKYPYIGNSPGNRWRNAFLPNTVMTPVTPEQVAANPEAVLLDTMPASYTLLGQHGDGTMGALGFGKILIQSGEFDRCVARRMYALMVGRQLNPASEKRYIDKLAQEFVARDRKLRPFLRYLFEQPEVRRGL